MIQLVPRNKSLLSPNSTIQNNLKHKPGPILYSKIDKPKLHLIYLAILRTLFPKAKAYLIFYNTPFLYHANTLCIKAF